MESGGVCMETAGSSESQVKVHQEATPGEEETSSASSSAAAEPSVLPSAASDEPEEPPPSSSSVPEKAEENGIEKEEEDDVEDVVMEQDPIELVAVVEEETKAEEDGEVEAKTAEATSSPPPPSSSEPAEDGSKTAEDSGAVEEQQTSSTSSSPSALHIHLDEEENREDSVNDKDKDAKQVDPSLPLISNVVSLSSGAGDDKSAPSPSPPTSSSPTPSAAGSSGATPRRTTLRLKRGIEISFDVDQNGQPVTVNNNNHQPTSGSSTGEPREKRERLEDEDCDDVGGDLSELDAEGTNSILAGVQKDIRTLRFMAKQKEKEWNYILKLMKVKEELQAKLMRRREVLKISTASSSFSGAGGGGSGGAGSGRSKLHLPSAAQLQAVAAQHQQQQSQASLQSFINQSLSAIMGGSNHSAKSSSGSAGSKSAAAGGSQTSSNSGANHQQQQQQLMFQQASKMLNRQRPILPKPSMQVHSETWNHHHHHSGGSSTTQLMDPGLSGQQHHGTISVQSLIADHRAKHPEEIPTRGRRIRQPSRICSDPNSSSSPPPSSQQGASDPAAVSFKDVLLQFAKMSSRQGLGNAVADMSQMGKDASGGSGGGLLGGTGSSSAAALQSLAAARNARTASPHHHHASSSSAGSILQSALSGSRTNPNFAPTLAQLLTNPANESQQSNQSALPAVAVAAAAAAAAAASNSSTTATPAEVLTLSNLLATAKGHVTITSDRDQSNEDVTVVGGGTSGSVRSSGGSGTSNSSGNYLRTSGGGEVPKCQGCNDRVAQFVCAGCSSQWYCSRECQVAAWEEHSEHCVG